MVDLVARLHARPRRHLTLLVAVDGPTGAGRTGFVQALAIADPDLEFVSVADFHHLPGDRSGADGETGVRGIAEGVDWRRLRSQLLLPLNRDQPGRYSVLDADTGLPAYWREVPTGGIVVVEGVYSCLRQLAGFYDFRIWVRSPVTAPEEEAYLAAHDPAGSAHMRVEGSGVLAHDPAREYVRLRQ